MGLTWLVVMMAQVSIRGFRAAVERRLALLFPVLARARHRLGRLFTVVYLMGVACMTDTVRSRTWRHLGTCRAGGDDAARRLIYTIGLVLAAILTAMSFWVANTVDCSGPPVCPLDLPSSPIAQMGPPGVFPSHHHRTGPHQQCTGVGVRRAHRLPGRRRFDVDHRQFEQQHDAASRANGSAYAALKHATPRSRSR